MIKKIFKLIIFFLVFSMFSINYSYAEIFNDIPYSFWAYREIENLTKAGIISGGGDGNYYPNQYITRAQYAVMVMKTIKKDDMQIETLYSFEDVDNKNPSWKYIQQAVNLDILKPVSDNYFYPNDYITRSDVITFLVNILRSEDITKKEAITALQNAYLDFDDIPDWFKLTAGKAEVLGVIAKEPPRQDYLDYDGYVTRAQIAVFLSRLKENIESYMEEKILAEKSPKIGEGIKIENVYIDGDVVTIPDRTVLPIMITGQLSTKDAQPGQMFQAKFANNIVDWEHHILLSDDIILIGKILDSKKAVNFVRNGGILFELSAINKNNHLTRILGVAEYQATITEANKVKKVAKKVIKGSDFTIKDGQILYIRLFKPLRANIVTGEVFD